RAPTCLLPPDDSAEEIPVASRCAWPSAFFFSSRRRHTSCYRDWSSDVCSSDLSTRWSGGEPPPLQRVEEPQEAGQRRESPPRERSEERRVGKECRSGWPRGGEKRKSIGMKRERAAVARSMRRQVYYVVGREQSV